MQHERFPIELRGVVQQIWHADAAPHSVTAERSLFICGCGKGPSNMLYIQRDTLKHIHTISLNEKT
eukprot:5758850-Amphidinium_carterae.1